MIANGVALPNGTDAVYWLQALTLYGDIRQEGGAEDQAQRMTAFAGRLSERDGVFRWSERSSPLPRIAHPMTDTSSGSASRRRALG